MATIKNLVVSNVIPLASKITEHKLNGPNHMTEDPQKIQSRRRIGIVMMPVYIFKSKTPLRVT